MDFREDMKSGSYISIPNFMYAYLLCFRTIPLLCSITQTDPFLKSPGGFPRPGKEQPRCLGSAAVREKRKNQAQGFSVG